MNRDSSAPSAQFSDSQWLARLDVPPLVVNAGNSWHGQHGDERYLLPHLWSFHLYRYEAELILDTVPYPIRYGSMSIVPPNIPIHYRYTETCEHFFVHFALEPASAVYHAAHFPVVASLGAGFDMEYAHLQEATDRSLSAAFHLRSHFWDLLCRLSHQFPAEVPSESASPNPLIRRVQSVIDHRLSRTISVIHLADEVGITPGYLVKLFQKHCGTTVVEYIRRRRMERAAHLITSTTMSVKAIAAVTGISDLHRFNKEIHRAFGCSPRQMRERAAPHQERVKAGWDPKTQV